MEREFSGLERERRRGQSITQHPVNNDWPDHVLPVGTKSHLRHRPWAWRAMHTTAERPQAQHRPLREGRVVWLQQATLVVKEASLFSLMQSKTHCCDHGVCVVGEPPVGISPAPLLQALTQGCIPNRNAVCVCACVRVSVCQGVKALGMKEGAGSPTQSRHNLNTDVTWVLAQERGST